MDVCIYYFLSYCKIVTVSHLIYLRFSFSDTQYKTCRQDHLLFSLPQLLPTCFGFYCTYSFIYCLRADYLLPSFLGQKKKKINLSYFLSCSAFETNLGLFQSLPKPCFAQPFLTKLILLRSDPSISHAASTWLIPIKLK